MRGCDYCFNMNYEDCIKSYNFVAHTETKEKQPRFRCKNCNRVFVPEDKKKQNENPSCPKCNENKYVQKHGTIYDKEKKQIKFKRYKCTQCEETFSINYTNYEPKKEGYKKDVINTWLTLRDEKFWQDLKAQFSESDANMTKNQYICKHHKISNSTLSRIIREYYEQRPDMFLQKEDRDKISKKIEKTYYDRRNAPSPSTSKTAYKMNLSVEREEDE